MAGVGEHHARTWWARSLMLGCVSSKVKTGTTGCISVTARLIGGEKATTRGRRAAGRDACVVMRRQM